MGSEVEYFRAVPDSSYRLGFTILLGTRSLIWLATSSMQLAAFFAKFLGLRECLGFVSFYGLNGAERLVENTSH